MRFLLAGLGLVMLLVSVLARPVSSQPSAKAGRTRIVFGAVGLILLIVGLIL